MTKKKKEESKTLLEREVEKQLKGAEGWNYDENSNVWQWRYQTTPIYWYYGWNGTVKTDSKKEKEESIESRIKRLEDTTNLWGTIFHDDIEKRIREKEKEDYEKKKASEREALAKEITELKRKMKDKKHSLKRNSRFGKFLDYFTAMHRLKVE